MNDPILHEAGLLQMLDCVCAVDNTSRVQAAAMMSLLDAFDRGVTREAFLRMLMTSFSLHTQMAKLYLLGEVCESYRAHMDEPKTAVFEGVLRTTQEDVRLQAIDLHGQIKAQMALLVQCPTSQDKVH